MMPLWPTASLGDACGWALVSVGLPCVAQRVWPMPIAPSSGAAASFASRFLSLPSARRRSQLAVLKRRYAGGIVAAIFEPLQRIDNRARDRPGPENPDNSTHSRFPCESPCPNRFPTTSLRPTIGAVTNQVRRRNVKEPRLPTPDSSHQRAIADRSL